jgi:hypothetical protein
MVPYASEVWTLCSNGTGVRKDIHRLAFDPLGRPADKHLAIAADRDAMRTWIYAAHTQSKELQELDNL